MASDAGLTGNVLAVIVAGVHAAWQGRVAADAKRVDARTRKQASIAGSVGRVAGGTALDLHGSMFKDEGTALLAVALEADGVLCGGRAQLMLHVAAVRVMTIRALHETFVDAVMKWFHERGLFSLVARIAQPGILLGQQRFADLGAVNGMAGNAGHPSAIVLGALERLVILIVLVALETLRRNFVGLQCLESKNFGFVTAALDVRLAGAVTRFTGLSIGSFGLPMRSPLNAFSCLFVTGLTLIGTYELGSICGASGFGAAGLIILPVSFRTSSYDTSTS